MGFLSDTQTPDGVTIPGTNFDYSYLQNRKVDVFSSALDFTLPFEKYKVTAGAKVSFTNTRNRINYDTSDPTLVQDDYFHYKEQIYALYADYNRAFGKQFSMQLGLRMEHTRTTGISESENTTDKHDYTRLFPTLYFPFRHYTYNSASGLPFHEHRYTCSDRTGKGSPYSVKGGKCDWTN